MLKHLRVFIFMILVLFQTIVFGTFFTIVNGFNSKFHQYQKKYMYIIYLYILNCKINVNNKIEYDDTKKYIIMSNHYTALDYFALNTIFPSSLTVVRRRLIAKMLSYLAHGHAFHKPGDRRSKDETQLHASGDKSSDFTPMPCDSQAHPSATLDL